MADITAQEIQIRIRDGITAFEANDYETALSKLMTAKMMMDSIPRMVLGTAQAKNEIQYMPEQLDRMIESVRKMASANSRGAGLFLQIPVERINTRSEWE